MSSYAIGRNPSDGLLHVVDTASNRGVCGALAPQFFTEGVPDVCDVLTVDGTPHEFIAEGEMCNDCRRLVIAAQSQRVGKESEAISDDNGDGTIGVTQSETNRVPSLPSMQEVKIAIVETLRKQPNHSCRRLVLPRLTIRTLGGQPRGHARAEVVRLVNIATTHLRHARVIKLYGREYPRLRLTDDYQERFNRLQLRAAKAHREGTVQELAAQAPRRSQQSKSPGGGEKRPARSPSSLFGGDDSEDPPLLSFSGDDGFDEEAPPETANDGRGAAGDTDALAESELDADDTLDEEIEELTTEGLPPLANLDEDSLDAELDSVAGIEEGGLSTAQDWLDESELSTFLNECAGVTMELALGELHCQAGPENRRVVASAVRDPRLGCWRIEVLLPLRSSRAMELLEYLSHDPCASQLRVRRGPASEAFILSRQVFSEEVNVVGREVLHALREAVVARTIIEAN